MFLISALDRSLLIPPKNITVKLTFFQVPHEQIIKKPRQKKILISIIPRSLLKKPPSTPSPNHAHRLLNPPTTDTRVIDLINPSADMANISHNDSEDYINLWANASRLNDSERSSAQKQTIRGFGHMFPRHDRYRRIGIKNRREARIVSHSKNRCVGSLIPARRCSPFDE